MLNAFLPGFRQLRVPLAVGALWLVAVGIVAIDLPAALVRDPVRDALEQLSWFGPAAALGAAAFTAYVIGTLTTSEHVAAKIYDAIRAGVARLTGLHGPVAVWFLGRTDPREESRRLVQQWVEMELNEAQRRGVHHFQVMEAIPLLHNFESLTSAHVGSFPDLTVQSLREALAGMREQPDRDIRKRKGWAALRRHRGFIVDMIMRDPKAVGESLLSSQPDLHDQLDRDRSEGEFRRDVALPIAVVISLCGTIFSEQLQPWASVGSCILGVAVGIRLFRDGMARVEGHTLALWRLLVDGVVPSREVQAIRSLERFGPVEMPKLRS